MHQNKCIHTQRREFIKYRLRLNGSSLAQVSRELGVTTATMSQVCLGARTSNRILKTLELRLGLEPGALKNDATIWEDAM